MPILPKIVGGYLLIPLKTAVAYLSWQYISWYALLYLVVGTTVINMDAIENIPGEYLVPTIVTIIICAIALYGVSYLVSFQEKRSKILTAKAEALKNGTAVDEIEVKRVEAFHLIYKVAMILGIIATTAITFALMASVVPAKITLDSSVNFCVASAIVTIITFALFDRFVGRPIADGTFKSKVLDPFVQNIIEQFQPALAESAETEETVLTAEDKKLLELIKTIKG